MGSSDLVREAIRFVGVVDGLCSIVLSGVKDAARQDYDRIAVFDRLVSYADGSRAENDESVRDVLTVAADSCGVSVSIAVGGNEGADLRGAVARARGFVCDRATRLRADGRNYGLFLKGLALDGSRSGVLNLFANRLLIIRRSIRSVLRFRGPILLCVFVLLVLFRMEVVFQGSPSVWGKPIMDCNEPLMCLSLRPRKCSARSFLSLRLHRRRTMSAGRFVVFLVFCFISFGCGLLLT